MSRALDPSETPSSHPTTSPQEVYTSLTTILCADRNDKLEIELLGSGFPIPDGQDYLFEGNCIGIPKSKLVQAFIVARQIFFKLAKPCPQANYEDLRKATTIMLLMDPEHLTAANERKRVILSTQKDENEDMNNLFREELQFVDTFLTAHLNRHTKSPTLWFHRRWILEQCRYLEITVDLIRDLKDLFLVAAERHPKNYYAWSHLRWFVNAFDPEGVMREEVLGVVADWCMRHPDDTSGFSFLLFYLAVVENAGQSAVAYEKVLGTALSFHWNHESVWVFLRTLAASGALSAEATSSFEEKAKSAMATSPENSNAQLLLKNAVKWFNENYQNFSA